MSDQTGWGPRTVTEDPRRIRGYGVGPAHSNGEAEVYGVGPSHCNGGIEVCGLGPAQWRTRSLWCPDPCKLRSRGGLRFVVWDPRAVTEDLRRTWGLMMWDPCTVKLELKHGHENRGHVAGSPQSQSVWSRFWIHRRIVILQTNLPALYGAKAWFFYYKATFSRFSRFTSKLVVTTILETVLWKTI